MVSMFLDSGFVGGWVVVCHWKGEEALSESHLSLKELVELVDIPENSCKRYMLEHEEFVRFDKVHNRYRIHASAVETIKTIRRLYGDGLKREAVDEYLRGSGMPVTLTVDSEESGTALINVNSEVAELKSMMKLQMEFNQRLVQQMEEREKERVERERRLLQEIQESNQLHQQEISDLKTLVNRKESEEISSLRKSLEDKRNDNFTNAIDSASEKAVKVALKEYQEFVAATVEAEPIKKGWLGKLFK